jgi:hypothetical protein
MIRSFFGGWRAIGVRPNAHQVQKFELDGAPKEISDHYPVFAEFFVDKDTD